MMTEWKNEHRDPVGIRFATREIILAVLAFALRASAEPSAPDTALRSLEQDVQRLQSEVETIRNDRARAGWTDRVRLGGYGELHANFAEDGGDSIDLHRLVLYVGASFDDSIAFHSEIEIEHAHVDASSGGYLIVEQAFMEFGLRPAADLRIGRILTPLGIINARHKPTTFHGVERPAFDRVIIPSTWMSDGIGLAGHIAPGTTYEVYVVGGLDGTGFSGRNGIREGRIRERPSLNEPAITGRVDLRPSLGDAVSFDPELRVGLSGYFGGIDNGNRGGDPGINGRVGIYSADMEATVGRFDFRGAIAYVDIDGAEAIGNETAEGILGWTAEFAARVLPEAWKRGRLKHAELALAIRYDDVDTQYRMPDGIGANPDFRRNEWTFAATFLPIPQVALKADYQVRQSRGKTDPENLFNLGVGWVF